MGSAASAISNFASSVSKVVTVANEGGKDLKDDDKEEGRDPRRRNSLAFYISQFVNFEGDDFGKVVEAVKADKYSKSGGKPPNIRNSKFSKIADSIIQGNMKELRNQVFVYFKTINRQYKDHHVGNTILHMICQEGFYPMLTYIANPENRSGLDSEILDMNPKNDKNRSPLFLCFTPPTATYNGLKNGVDDDGNVIPVRSEDIESASDWIKPGGPKSRENCIKFLLEQGVDPNEKDFQDFAPLHFAAMWGWSSTVKILTDYGADVNIPTQAGKTPLMYAIEFDHESLVFWFASQAKKLNLRLDATDVDGYTALIRAIEKGDAGLNMAKILLQFGADPNVLTLRRKTALKIACQMQNMNLVNLLMDYQVQRRNSAFNLLKEDLMAAVQNRIVEEEKKAVEEAEKQQKEQELKERMGYAEKAHRKNIFDAWVEYIDKKSKKPFYYNTVTRKSTFDKPKEYKPNKKHLAKEVIYGCSRLVVQMALEVDYAGKTINDVVGTIAACCRTQEGSKFLQRAIREGSSETHHQIFQELEPVFVSLMTDNFGNYVLQKMVVAATMEQIAAVVPNLVDDIFELSENGKSNYLVQQLLQIVCTRVGDKNLPREIEQKFSDFLTDICEMIRMKLREFSCHHIATRVVLCLIEHLPESWLSPFLNDFVVVFEDLATNFHGSYVLNDALKYGREEFSNSVARNVNLHVIQYSQNQYASKFVENFLIDPRYRSKLCGKLIEGCFPKNKSPGQEGAILQMLKSDSGLTILRLMQNVCDQDHLKIIDQFFENNREEVSRINFEKEVMSNIASEGKSNFGNGINLQSHERRRSLSGDEMNTTTQPQTPKWLVSLCSQEIVRLGNENEGQFLSLPDANWFDSVQLLLERQRYRTIRDRFMKDGDIINPEDPTKSLKPHSKVYFEVSDMAGMGKSFFVVWLISDIFSRARNYRINNSNWLQQESKTHLHSPSILYYPPVRKEEKGFYWLLRLDMEPVPFDNDSRNDCHFLFLDDHDLINAYQHPYRLYLAVASDPDTLTFFNKRASGEAGPDHPAGRNMLFSLTFDECVRMFVDSGVLTLEQLTFRFDIVGGNPRFLQYKARSMDDIDGDHDLSAAIEQAVTALGLSNADFDWVNNILMMNASTKAEKDVKKSSLFLQFLKTSQGILKSYSSTFMNVLAKLIINIQTSHYVATIKKIFGSCGLGYYLEYNCHQSIVNSYREWYAIPLDCKDEHMISSLPFQHLEFFHLRAISDLRALQNGQYGLPTVANFPVVDAIARVDNIFYFLQMTIAKYHATSERFRELVEVLPEGIQIRLVWFLSNENFNLMKADTGIIPQYQIVQLRCLQTIQTRDGLMVLATSPMKPEKKRRLTEQDKNSLGIIKRLFDEKNDNDLKKELYKKECVEMATTVGVVAPTKKTLPELISLIRRRISQLPLPSEPIEETDSNSY